MTSAAGVAFSAELPSVGCCSLCFLAAVAAKYIQVCPDSGASRPIFKDRELFRNYKLATGIHIKTAGASAPKLTVQGTGTVRFQMPDVNGKIHTFDLHNCLHVPDASANLFSVRSFCASMGGHFCFASESGWFEANGSRFEFTVSGSLYAMQLRVLLGTDTSTTVNVAFLGALDSSPNCATKSNSATTFDTWHRRLCHMSVAKMKLLPRFVRGFQLKDDGKLENVSDRCPCKVCSAANFQSLGLRGRTVGAAAANAAMEPSEVTHVDGLDGFKVPSCLQGYKMAYLFVDEKSHRAMVYGVRHKSQYLDVLQEYVTYMRSHGHKVKNILVHVKSDYAAELSAGRAKKWCSENLIQTVHSVPHVPDDNKLIETYIKLVKKLARVAASSCFFTD